MHTFFIGCSFVGLKKYALKKLNLKVTKINEKRVKYKYKIYFQRGNVLKFTSKRKADDYLRTFTSSTNDLIRSCINLHSKFYTQYLGSYFEIHSNKCNRVQRKMDIFLERLEYCFKEYSLGNESIAINAVWSLLNCLEDSIKELRGWYRVNNRYNSVNECNSLLQMHDFLYSRFYDMMRDTEIEKTYKSKTLTIAYKSASLMTV